MLCITVAIFIVLRVLRHFNVWMPFSFMAIVYGIHLVVVWGYFGVFLLIAYHFRELRQRFSGAMSEKDTR